MRPWPSRYPGAPERDMGVSTISLKGNANNWESSIPSPPTISPTGVGGPYLTLTLKIGGVGPYNFMVCLGRIVGRLL